MQLQNMDTEHTGIKRAYEDWMASEGIPVFEASAAVDDVTALPREPWPRMGGKGTFIQLLGPRQAGRGIYVAEIPGGGALNPERHLYDEVLYVLEGHGATEVWYDGEPKQAFEWGPGSIFAMPINLWHRLFNGSRESALILAFTRAPRLFQLFNNTEFIFNNDFKFPERYAGESSYFVATENRVARDIGRRERSVTWFTNFIPNVSRTFLDDTHKVSGGQMTHISMGSGFPHGHISGWPVGRYHKAHYHGPGATIVGVSGQGFVVLWPKGLGIHPFQDGHGDEVVMVDWGPRSIYAPPDGWFHQHMSTGAVPARHWAIHGEPLSFSSVEDHTVEVPTTISVRAGGTLIEYEDEDPEIRRLWEARCRAAGVEPTMPPVTYRNDPLAVRP